MGRIICCQVCMEIKLEIFKWARLKITTYKTKCYLNALSICRSSYQIDLKYFSDNTKALEFKSYCILNYAYEKYCYMLPSMRKFINYLSRWFLHVYCFLIQLKVDHSRYDKTFSFQLQNVVIVEHDLIKDNVLHIRRDLDILHSLVFNISEYSYKTFKIHDKPTSQIFRIRYIV